MPVASAAQKLILIVDDTPTNIGVISGALKNSYQTKIATNGQKALALASGEDKPDLILLDVMMPKISGFEVCKRLRRDPTTRDIAVLMVTALDQPSDIERAIDAGTTDFVSKPIEKNTLLLRVRSLLSSRQYKRELDRLLAYIEAVEREEQ